MRLDERRTRVLWLALLFGLGFSVREGCSLRNHTVDDHLRAYGDGFGAEMERSALAVSRHGSIRDVFGEGTGSSAHVSPAYAYVLGAVYRLAGPDPRRMLHGQVLLSCLIAAGTIALLPTVARRTGLGPAAGVAAGLAMTFLPNYFWVQVNGDWEQPLSSLTLLLLLLDFEAGRREGWRSAAGLARSGLLLGWAALLSPPVALAGGLMALPRFVLVPGEGARVARGLLLEGLIVAAVLAPWVARNAREIGGFIPLRSNFGLELDISNHDRADGRFDIHATDRHPYTSSLERGLYRRIGERAYMRSKLQTALGWIVANPARFAGLVGRRVLLYWFPARDLWSLPGARNPVVGLLLSDGAVCLMNGLGLAGLALLARRRSPARWAYAAALLGPSLIYSVIQLMPRYRYPSYPVTLLLGGLVVLEGLARVYGVVGRRAPASGQAAGPDAAPIAPPTP